MSNTTTSALNNNNSVKVAVGVIVVSSRQLQIVGHNQLIICQALSELNDDLSNYYVCIAKRTKNAHQGGLWEFSGGKLEQGEKVPQALKRELKEELSIDILTSEPLLEVNWQYSDKNVQLLVHQVTQFKGAPKSAEGQQVEWVKLTDLSSRAFPEANTAIIKALLRA